MSKIVAFCANPINEPVLRVGYEVNMIEQGITKAVGYPYAIEKKLATEISDLQQYLHEKRPEVVHFIGHGTDDGEFILENNHGYSLSINEEVFDAIFSHTVDFIKCVVFNFCNSTRSALSVVRHVPLVIGWPTEVADDISVGFATSFYYYLAKDKAIEIAFSLARTELVAVGLPSGSLPRLEIRDDYRLKNFTIRIKPRLYAEFYLSKNDKIEGTSEVYYIKLSIQDYPSVATEVRYFLNHKSFKYRNYRSKNVTENFYCDIESYGDCEIQTTIWNTGGIGFGFTTKLSDALINSYGETPIKKVKKAIEDIKDH